MRLKIRSEEFNTEPHSTFWSGDVREVLQSLPEDGVHTCVTSPPYWGLRSYELKPVQWRDWTGSLGDEPTPEMYVDHLVEIFQSVRRVLRPDGTLWLNLGHTHWGGKGKSNLAWCKEHPDRETLQKPHHHVWEKGETRPQDGKHPIFKPKDLVPLPWMVGLALIQDGWYLRMDCIWEKKNPNPESIKDRPSKVHEYILMFSRNPKYYFDQEAVREPSNANRRSVWTLPVMGYKGAHFATFPPQLPELCIAASTSEKGCCPYCGTGWKRMVKETVEFHSGSGKAENPPQGKHLENPQSKSGTYDLRMGPKKVTETIGWEPDCSCGSPITVPCLVLDPFGGSGTTSMVARNMGRSSIYIDLNPSYLEMAKERTNNKP